MTDAQTYILYTYGFVAGVCLLRLIGLKSLLPNYRKISPRQHFSSVIIAQEHIKLLDIWNCLTFYSVHCSVLGVTSFQGENFPLRFALR